MNLHLREFWPWGLYAAAPAADVAQHSSPTWLTAVGAVCALGGLACHAVQTWCRVRESAAKVGK